MFALCWLLARSQIKGVMWRKLYMISSRTDGCRLVKSHSLTNLQQTPNPPWVYYTLFTNRYSISSARFNSHFIWTTNYDLNPFALWRAYRRGQPWTFHECFCNRIKPLSRWWVPPSLSRVPLASVCPGGTSDRPGNGLGGHSDHRPYPLCLPARCSHMHSSCSVWTWTKSSHSRITSSCSQVMIAWIRS